MRVLLDTHVFLWFISGDPRMRTEWTDAIRDGGNEVFLSVVSIWEALAKHGRGKLPLPARAAEYLAIQREQHGIASLPLTEGEVVRVSTLPPIHGDPFDRMLVCQALANNLVIATGDLQITQYAVPTL